MPDDDFDQNHYFLKIAAEKTVKKQGQADFTMPREPLASLKLTNNLISC